MKEQVTITYTLDEVLQLIKKEYLELREVYDDSIDVKVLIEGVNIQSNNDKIIWRRQYVDDLIELCNTNRRLEAIKLLRTDFPLSLKDAKDFTGDSNIQEHFVKTGEFNL